MLFLFDLDGTLLRPMMDPRFVGEYDVVSVLPRRYERLRDIIRGGHQVAIITNQVGVAFGRQSEGQVHSKLNRALRALGLPKDTPRYVCTSHPHATIPRYRRGHDRRKPSGAMLEEAMKAAAASPDETVYVGDLDVDRAAAVAARTHFVHADEFFDTHRPLWSIGPGNFA